MNNDNENELFGDMPKDVTGLGMEVFDKDDGAFSGKTCGIGCLFGHGGKDCAEVTQAASPEVVIEAYEKAMAAAFEYFQKPDRTYDGIMPGSALWGLFLDAHDLASGKVSSDEEE